MLKITESRSTELDLTEEQAQELQRLGKDLRGQISSFWANKVVDGTESEDDRSVIVCVPSSNGKYSVRVSNAIGMLALPGTQLSVVPKIPMNHFSWIAQRSIADPRIGGNKVGIDSLDAFWELVCIWCVHEIEMVLRQGLLSDYKSITDDIEFVRGRVNLRPSIANFFEGRPVVECTFDELDIDFPAHRLMRAALRVVSAHPNISSADLRRRASRADRMFSGVGDLQSLDFRTTVDRRTKSYERALDLSRRVLFGSGIDVKDGPVVGQSFLIPTPGLIEDGLRKILQHRLVPLKVEKLGRQIPGNSFFSINPDLVFAGGRFVGDVKYKLAEPGWDRSSVAQISMFANGFGSHVGLILSFANSEEVPDLVMDLGHLRVSRIIWRSSESTSPVDAETDFVLRCQQHLVDINSVGVAS